ncbi:MAG: BrnT family toxin [Planctomycetota bacterium]
MPVKFKWDGVKAALSVTKHGVTFDEASTVFGDPLAVIFDDEEHCVDEIREIIIGHSILERLLLVSFTERGDDTVRIISARKATKRERKDYEQGTRR